ncbi:phage tail protein [Latilactobacillus curvatus]|uniref:Phage tail protein n=1 Tax=Latilactobacillus curvatus TaxID=28038 RepID=A0A385AFV1_LATCU|nr:phage tail protein [Latilactobacillus curvatus]AXN36186.1 phage tail protein [Latilactobacillus curvatus]
MATELGQAYVQIVPSAKGISGAIKGQLDPEADSAGKSAGSKIGTGIKIAAVAGVAAVGATLGKIISSSLSEGADLQQSLGGIETLFKGSADKVKGFADQAYKTAGLSANDYMENVTSFSASLLQSVGGDTEKAANIGNMAMIDMSDNANKMGTNIGDIQNSYQGFAKQNYTMLDNLKLGYGGTKEEMQRLLTDAQKITGQKYDMSNLSDVYSAIHAVQGELDITGTTAKEAASTFSGSFDSMKAAMSNVLGKMSLGQDITPSLQALAATTSTFLFNNFIPMVGNVLKALPSAITTFITAAAPSFVAGGQKLISGLTQGMSGGNGAVTTALSGMMASVSTFGTTLQTTFQTIFQTLAPVVTSTLGTMLGQLPGLFATVINAITPVVQMIGTAFSQLDFSGLQTLASAVVPAISAGFSTMMGIVGPAISSVVTSFVALWNAAQPLITVLAGALMPAFQVIGAFLGGVFKGILMGISAAFDAVRIVIGILTPVISLLVSGFQAIAPALTVVAGWVGTVMGLFAGLGGAGGSLRTILSGAWNNIKSAVSIAGSAIGGAINGVKVVFSALGSAGSSLRSLLSSAWNLIRSAISAAGSGIMSIVNGIKNVFGGLGGAGNTAKALVSGAFNGMRSVVSNVAGSIKGVINGIKSVFSSLGNINLSSAGHAIMNGFLGGLKAAYGKVKDFVGGIAKWIKEHKGPISYDRKLLIPAGNAIMGGLNNSLQDSFRDVQSTVSGMADKLSLSMTPAIAFDEPAALTGNNLAQMMRPTPAVYNTYSAPTQDAANNVEMIDLLRIIADKRTVVDGSSFASAYEEYGSTETARRSQLKERGLAIDNKI